MALWRGRSPNGPRLLLLDEPLAALDKKLREETQFELMDLQHALGMTFVVVTHDQEEAMTMADRIAVMDHGRIVQVATPGEIYEQPKTRFIAEFVGDVNILEGRVRGQEDGLWRVATPSAAGAAHHRRCRRGSAAAARPSPIAVRPEKMLIHREPPAPTARNVLAGEVWDIGYLGDWTIYRVKLALRRDRARVPRQQAPLRREPDRLGRAGLRHLCARRGGDPGGIAADPRAPGRLLPALGAGAAVPLARRVLPRCRS